LSFHNRAPTQTVSKVHSVSLIVVIHVVCMLQVVRVP